jgi:hypothetical protein
MASSIAIVAARHGASIAVKVMPPGENDAGQVARTRLVAPEGEDDRANSSRS